MEHRRHKRDETNRQKDSLKEGKGSTQKGSTYFISELYKIPGIYWAQNEMYMGGDRKKEKRFVGQRVVYDDGIKAYKTKCLRGFN